MVPRSNTPHWEALKLTFLTQNQTDECNAFYIHAVDFLEAMDIDTDTKDPTKLKMIFEGKYFQALQTFIDKDTISQKDQKMPIRVLGPIQAAITQKDHFWHYRDEMYSNFTQQPD